MVPFFFLAEISGRFISSVYCGNLIELPEVNFTVLWGIPSMIGFSGIFNSRVFHTEAPTICPLYSGFPIPTLDPQVVSACESVLW